MECSSVLLNARSSLLFPEWSQTVSRLCIVDVNESSGDRADVFGIEHAFGKIPKAYTALGSNSPALLAQVLRIGAVLQTKSLLSKRELEAINFAVSEEFECDNRLATTRVVGDAEVHASEPAQPLRTGRYSDEAKTNALMKFASRLVTTTGALPADAVEAMRRAGFDNRQVFEAVTAIAAVLLTNMLNRVNDTALPCAEAR